MVLVLRVENEDGIGMYTAPYEFYDEPMYVWEMGNPETHPSPPEDEGLLPRWINLTSYRDWFFGFYDKTQLDNWIYKDTWKKELAKIGCKISTYEVAEDDFIRGHRQCVFVKARSTLIDRKDFE
jgi:hypothetical protein